MTITELIKSMMRSFFIIATGIMISIAVSCFIFNPKAMFSIEIFGQILLLSALSVLPHLLFYSKIELSKNQMLRRQILHVIVLLILLLSFAYAWQWIAWNNIVQQSVFLFQVLLVYLLVRIFIFKKDKRTADKLNLALKKYKDQQNDNN